MKARYKWRENVVLARCPNCNANTSFDTKGTSNTSMGCSIIDATHTYQGKTFTRILWQALRCSSCGRGGVAQLHDDGRSQTAVLEDFIPHAVDNATVPRDVPDDILREFREAELDATHGAYRSGCAMLRSAIEKTLKKNGYEVVHVEDDEGNQKKSNKLIDRIDAAADDGILTETMQRRAHGIRVLGNDILHDDWREVPEGEFTEAHKYTAMVLSAFYDLRAVVEEQLTTKGRSFWTRPQTSD